MTTLDGLRVAVDGDAEALAALIGSVYAEYSGCVLDLAGVDADLTAIATTLAAKDGLLWVLPAAAEAAAGGLAACGGYAWSPLGDEPALELKRLYVRADHRRRGLGRALATRVLAVAAERAVATVHLWSDTRFADAHRLYASLGFERQPETRDLHDPSHTTEYHYVRRVAAGH